MRLGDIGGDVDEVKEFLVSRGFLSEEGSYERGYGVNTKIAVIKLQKAIEAEPTGIWDDALRVLFEHDNPSPGNILLSEKRILTRTSTIVPIGEGETVLSDNPNQPAPDWTFDESGRYQGSVYRPMESARGTAFLTARDPINFYVMNLNTNKIIFFPTLPESVSDSVSANFDDEQVRGRSSPFKGYINTGPRSISFTVTLYQDYCTEGIVQTERALRALVYPGKDSVILSPVCMFRLGNFFQVKGAPTSISTEWRPPYKNGVYSFADVTIGLDEVEDVGITSADVEGGA